MTLQAGDDLVVARVGRDVDVTRPGDELQVGHGEPTVRAILVRRHGTPGSAFAPCGRIVFISSAPPPTLVRTHARPK
jgi:hypothetical protein